ncbi:Rne/Rng family ribonuclease [Metabacillus arenae]|uniref:Ribonuclease G n=1 Tax=Metabacillus arenae TaxID=2771434 RepID=A0A926NH59_9BACI|nr:Rne/Rng family ribonuclease [Metabacillus arenae]MBD1381206.1 Rne/Rng family ribonuclease [Metabacillus arenae]
MQKIIFNMKGIEKRCAVIEDDKLVNLYMEQPTKKEIVGHIYLGRITDVKPGMQAAFVDIGMEKSGYLHKNDIIKPDHERETSISKLVHEGETVLVQVSKEGSEFKGPKLTTNIEISGNYLVYMPNGNYVAISKKIADEEKRTRLNQIGDDLLRKQEGLLFRTAAMEVNDDILIEEIIQLQASFAKIQKKTAIETVPSCVFEGTSFIERVLHEHPLANVDEIICDQSAIISELKALQVEKNGIKIHYFHKKENVFSHFHLDGEIQKLVKQIVWLDNGAYIVIQETEALTVIDVNSGKFTGKYSMRDTVMKTNMAAAKEAAHQIKLRNLSGMILIDFIDMRHREDKAKLQNYFASLVKNESRYTNVLGFTNLNILEITRKKVKEPIHKLLTDPCPTCQGTGIVPAADAVAFQLERMLWEHQYMDHEAIWIETTKEVYNYLKGDKTNHILRLEEALKFKIYITIADKVLHEFTIKQAGKIKDIENRIRS